MSWVIRRVNYDTDEREFLLHGHERVPGERYFIGEANDLEWGKGRLPWQFLYIDEAYNFIAKYVRTARIHNHFQVYEDYGYLPVWYE